ncbi:alginate O-acetyltransferase [Tabrizicola sp.]|uniref:alginate O-acetyltransferase n=1 Tax=Tabrizicola sp. TaxID=2005166 RepID=UPI0035AFD258
MMRAALILSAILLPGAALAQQSQFQCSRTQYAPTASIEGKDGVFYRVQSDLRLQHPMDDIVVGQLAHLSRVLAEQGTTLIFVNVPTKGQAMPAYLPPEAAAYGYDAGTMQANYRDVIDRLTAAGVAAPDLMTAMLGAGPDEKVFFQADFHWTPAGARLAARAIGEMIRSHPAYADVTPVEFTSQEGPVEVAFSGLRRELQTFCKDSLPPVEATTWITTRAAEEVNDASDIFADAGGGEAAPAEAGTLDIFGTGEAEASLALVGTSFSDSSVNNFAGFLSEYAGIEAVNYAITGGNQFGAMTSYLTSREFAEDRPTFLVWENPIYNSLAQFGPVPMDELIAAAGPACDIETGAAPEGPDTLAARFEPGQLKPADAFLFDLGGEGSRVATVTLEGADGITRSIRIERGDRLRATGRFFLRLEPYWRPDLTRVAVTFDRPLRETSALTLCPTPKGDDS